MTSETSLRYRIAAYRGDEPFAFFSYSHDDSVLVFAELEALAAAGLRFYYDEGIHPGHTWHDELAKAIERCAVFVLFITARSVASRNCQRELAFALDNDKPVVAVHLEDTPLPSGVRLAIGDRQAIVRSRFDDARYRERLIAAIREHVGATNDEGVARTDERVEASTPKRSRTPWIAGVVVAIAAFLGWFAFVEWRDAQIRRAAAEAAIDDAEKLVESDQYGAAFSKIRGLVEADAARSDKRL